MSTTVGPPPPTNGSTGSKSKKQRRKKGGGKTKSSGNLENTNGATADEEIENDDIEGAESAPRTPLEIDISHDGNQTLMRSPKARSRHSSINGVSVGPVDAVLPMRDSHDMSKEQDAAQQNLVFAKSDLASSINQRPTDFSSKDVEARFDALTKERTALQDEVAQLRRSLEQVQEKHEEELMNLRDQLDESRNEKAHAESQYRNLLGKVNTIKSQLGERLKADAEDLSQARNRIDELEQQCRNLTEENETRSAELAAMAEDAEQRSREMSTLRNQSTLSQQNWSKEREDLIQRESFAREEFEAAKQAMQDWEVLAMEERSIRESITERVADLEEQLTSQREAHERAASERDSQSLTVDGLQRALQEIQDARKRELREMVENSQEQLDQLQKKLHAAELEATEAKKSLESTKNELERALPFEREVKEKNLLIGKLRHEAVILNDHLTKALRFLRKGKPEDNIDKQLISNHILQFLALERSDPKKFQILQIIAALLAWTDEQREQAGLARPGASNPNLRVPVSPWHRTPSTPALSTEFFPEGGTRKESLAELWSDFLEQQAQEGAKSPVSPTAITSNKPT